MLSAPGWAVPYGKQPAFEDNFNYQKNQEILMRIRNIDADHLRRGKDELGYARVKDADSNWKLIQQSIFKDKPEQAEKLKKEFSS